MIRGRGRRALPLFALFASFCAGVLVDGWLRTYGPPKAGHSWAELTPPPDTAPPPSRTDDSRRVPDRVPDPPAASAASPSTVAGGAVMPLRLPIDGLTVESFRGGFEQIRDDRPHEAVDIAAPRGTEVHAVQDGEIAKLFLSKAGGITIYQFDPDGRLCYYYAHLDRYVDGLHEGQHVSRGEVIAYVGTSGNAPPDAPHLHFAIFELNAERKWWQGRPLDPYLVFKEHG
jgi:murein DD-endopeptidase MepM/ murein hydrolase activator NlpD